MALTLLRVEERDPPGDHAVLLEFLDAPPAGSGRQADPAADLGDRDGGVLLQDLQDLAVKPVDHSCLRRVAFGIFFYGADSPLRSMLSITDDDFPSLRTVREQ